MYPCHSTYHVKALQGTLSSEQQPEKIEPLSSIALYVLGSQTGF